MKILLVEDMPDIMADLEKFVNDSGFYFQSASSVSEALEKLSDCGFDIVISDLHLNDGSGFDNRKDCLLRYDGKYDFPHVQSIR